MINVNVKKLEVLGAPDASFFVNISKTAVGTR